MVGFQRWERCQRAGGQRHPQLAQPRLSSPFHDPEKVVSALTEVLVGLRQVSVQCTMAAADPRFEVNDDGTAKDPVAFRQALREDKDKLKIIEVRPPP
jgi:hypothetical protein